MILQPNVKPQLLAFFLMKESIFSLKQQMTSKNEPPILKFLHSISQPPTSYPVLKPHNKDSIFTSKQHGIGKPNHQFPYSDNPPVIEVSPEYGNRRRRRWRFKSLSAAGNTAMVRWCAVCCPYLRRQKIK